MGKTLRILGLLAMAGIGVAHAALALSGHPTEILVIDLLAALLRNRHGRRI